MSHKKVSQHHHLRHWYHVILKRRRQAIKINSGQMALGQFLMSLFGAVIAGFVLELNKESIAAIIGAFLILPGVIDISGSLGSSLSAKINHRIEKRRANSWRIFISTFIFTYSVALLSGIIVSLIGAAVAWLLFDADFNRIFLLTEVSIAISCAICLPIIGIISILLKKRGVNPDDVIGPIESSITGVLSVLIIAIVARMLV